LARRKGPIPGVKIVEIIEKVSFFEDKPLGIPEHCRENE
jgi:hypothetical protein